eukprot:3267756-Rhodomonas_salina.1
MLSGPLSLPVPERPGPCWTSPAQTTLLPRAPPEPTTLLPVDQRRVRSCTGRAPHRQTALKNRSACPLPRLLPHSSRRPQTASWTRFSSAASELRRESDAGCPNLAAQACAFRQAAALHPRLPDPLDLADEALAVDIIVSDRQHRRVDRGWRRAPVREECPAGVGQGRLRNVGAAVLRRRESEGAADPLGAEAAHGGEEERERRDQAEEGEQHRVRRLALLHRGRVLGRLDRADHEAIQQRRALHKEAEDLRVEDGARAVRPEAHGGDEGEEGDGEDDGDLAHAAAPHKDGRARREELARELDQLPVPVRRVVGQEQKAQAPRRLVLDLVEAVLVPLDLGHREHAAARQQTRRLPEQAQQLRARALPQLMHTPRLHPRDRDLGRPELGVARRLRPLVGRGVRLAPVVREQHDDLRLRELLLHLVPFEVAMALAREAVLVVDPHTPPETVLVVDANLAALVLARGGAAEACLGVLQAGAPVGVRETGTPAPGLGRARGPEGHVQGVVGAVLDEEEDHRVDARLVHLLPGQLRDLEVPHDPERAEDDAEREDEHADHRVREEEAVRVVVRTGFAVVGDEEAEVVGDAVAVEGRDRDDRDRRVDQEQERSNHLPALVDAAPPVRAAGEVQEGERGRQHRADEDGRDGVEQQDVLVGRADADT